MLENLQTFFSAQMYPIVIALAVIALAFVLVSIMRRVVTLLLGGMAPDWIDRVTILLQAAVLVSELAIIVNFIKPSLPVLWPASLLLALVAAALLPGNPISDSVAFLRIRSLGYYRVGDWVTVAGDHYGCVVAIRPLSTLLQMPTQECVRLSNSSVVRARIIVHTTPQATPLAILNRVPVELADTQMAVATTTINGLLVSNAAVMTIGVDGGESTALPAPASAAVWPVYINELPLQETAPLVKRPALGKRSIKSLYR